MSKKLKYLTNLRIFELQCNQVGDETFQSICLQLPYLTKMEKFSFQRTL